MKASKNAQSGTKWIFLKAAAIESFIFCMKLRRGVRSLVQKYFLADFLGIYYIFEILHTSLIIKNSANVVKSGCFGKPLRWRDPAFSS